MGQLLNFSGQKEHELGHALHNKLDLINLLPKIKMLKGETLLVNIRHDVIQDKELLSKVVNEIIVLKCMGVLTIIVVDADEKVFEYYQNKEKENPFADNDCASTNGINDVVEVLIKHETTKCINDIIFQKNAMSMSVIGVDMNIILSDDVFNKNISMFDKQNCSITDSLRKKKKKDSVDVLNEILDTDILPILVPTCKDAYGNTYVMNSSYFTAKLASCLNAFKMITLYKDNSQIPTSCIYGVERFMKIIKSGSFNDKTMKMMKYSINGVKSGVQIAQMIDVANASIMEELCNETQKSLTLYDDTLQSI